MTYTTKRTVETDLFPPVRDFLMAQGFLVRSEVMDCDVTAVKDGKLIVVELKRYFSVELLAQGVERQKTADAVFLAIPKPKQMRMDSKWKGNLYLLDRLGLGLIFVSLKGKSSWVEVVQDAKPSNRKATTSKRSRILAEIHGRLKDYNKGGSVGRKIVTAYREQAIFIACCLKKLGASTPKALRQLGTDPKKTTAILYNNYYGWFDRIDRGLYGITEKGKQDLKSYPEIVQHYNEKIVKNSS